MGEKFAINPITGTASMTVPIATSPGRSGFGTQIFLTYDSGASKGPFGFGWNIAMPSITRQTDRGLPRYFNADKSDVFVLSGAEDLVPRISHHWQLCNFGSPPTEPGDTIQRYRSRIERLFTPIKRWTKENFSHLRPISKDNITSHYGKSNEPWTANLADSARIFA